MNFKRGQSVLCVWHFYILYHFDFIWLRVYKNQSVVPFHKKTHKSDLFKVKVKFIQLFIGGVRLKSSLGGSKFNILFFVWGFFCTDYFLQRWLQLTHFSSFYGRLYKCTRGKSGSPCPAKHWYQHILRERLAVITKVSCVDHMIFSYSQIPYK